MNVLKKNRGADPPAHDDTNLFLLLFLCFWGGREETNFFLVQKPKANIYTIYIRFSPTLSVYTEEAVHARVHALFEEEEKRTTFFVVVEDFMLTYIYT